MAALKKLAVPAVRVRREGEVREIPAPELVPGDIVLLEAGNLVPADGRLLESANLRIQEAILTGESEPIEKITAAVSGADLPLGDQRNMAFMGTTVTYGRGLMVVTDIGMSTAVGPRRRHDPGGRIVGDAAAAPSRSTGPRPGARRLCSSA